MKKYLILAVALLCIGLYAADADSKENENSGWDFITCTFVPGVPPAKDVLDIYGVKLGVPIGVGDSLICGVEISFLASMTKHVCGVQTAVLFNEADEVEGLQASFIYNKAKNVKGVQFSLVNVAEDVSFQIGLLNFIKNSPLKCFPFINCRF